MALRITDKRKEAVEELKKYFVFHKDFPKKGINFWDVFALFRNRKALALINVIIEEYACAIPYKVDVVVGLEARGFLFGPILANLLDCIFVPIRKRGKLPGPVYQEKYTLEYDEAIMEIQESSVKPGQSVIIIDDCLATGGTLNAAHSLIKQCRGTVVDTVIFYVIPDIEERAHSIPVTCLCTSDHS